MPAWCRPPDRPAAGAKSLSKAARPAIIRRAARGIRPGDVARSGAREFLPRSTAQLVRLGVTPARVASIEPLAGELHNPELTVESSRTFVDTISSLSAIEGVGDEMAHYIAMRAFGEPDAFPTTDLGLLRALNIKTPRELEARAEAWRPWRAYAAMYLWATPEHTSLLKLSRFGRSC